VTRHRAPQRPVTPLSDLSEALTGQLAIVRRSGAIVALSTGLVASVSVPAQAFADTSGPISAPGVLRSAVIAAPSTATVTFETGAFKAVPAPVQVPVQAPVAAPAVAPGSAAPGSSVLSVASRYVGVPYLYGGMSPRGFDCSGFTGYVYRQLGFSLPRTANEQLLATRRISRSEARPGDLVFFVSGGRAYHSGIYAGASMMYDAPRTGKTLQKREIWSADVVFTRVTG
jgi:cell wall-associated NlpC family hydrolase